MLLSIRLSLLIRLDHGSTEMARPKERDGKGRYKGYLNYPVKPDMKVFPPKKDRLEGILSGLDDFFARQEMRVINKLERAEERVHRRRFELYGDGDADPRFGAGSNPLDLVENRR